MYRCVRRGRERRQGISDVLVHGANISGASRRWKAPKRRGATPGARHNAASTQPPPLLNFPSPRPSTLLPLLFLLPSFFFKEKERGGDFYSSCIRINPFFANFECMEYIFLPNRLLEFKDSSTFYLLILSFLKFFFYLLYRRIEIRKDE